MVDLGPLSNIFGLSPPVPARGGYAPKYQAALVDGHFSWIPGRKYPLSDALREGDLDTYSAMLDGLSDDELAMECEQPGSSELILIRESDLRTHRYD